MNKLPTNVTVVLKAIGLALAVANIVLGILNATSVETQVALLSLGLFALALAGFQQSKEENV